MALTNADRVGKALELLNKGLQPFVEREMQAVYGERWLAEAVEALRDSKVVLEGRESWDTQALLNLMSNRWMEVFKRTLGRTERGIVGELRDARNRWAHQEPFSTDDAYRTLDSIHRLLEAVSAPEAAEVERQKNDLLRLKFEEQARNVVRRTSTAPTLGQPRAGLLPWREVVTPHPDVARGTYLAAEFAADLWKVHAGEGASSEYADPVEFFRRTYLTEGLRDLLVTALKRLSGTGGEPVVELQTNFGGGKTHSMLALYHLFSGARPQELPGLEEVLAKAGLTKVPRVNRVVLVGTRISPGQPVVKPDGTVVRTLWGELAYQLGEAEGGKGPEAYAMVREADETATNPGDALARLFKRYGPALLLIDEWVAYARQLHDQADLPAGSFETHFTFAQALSEVVAASPDTMLVVSIPASDTSGRNALDIEVGGERGRLALQRLKNAIGRIHSPWRPATSDESFEIVRRRLFEPIPSEMLPQRDAVVKAFMEMYRAQAGEFPPETREADYERKLKAAYPIHPELFERLYSDWSSLEKFQRTRGVLRLMATVIHELWEREDRSLMILPANLPLDASAVQSELTRYLEDNWVPIIERDVDGPDSLPLRLDREHAASLGRYSAARRVARTIYMGSAPTLKADNRGLEDRRIKLGCVQPGETVAIFGDALRRLTDQATHLYVNGQRYWFSTQPSVTRLAQERAHGLDGAQVAEEVTRRLREELRNRGDFPRVHVAPESTADVPDELEAALVVLGPEYTYSRGDKDREAFEQAPPQQFLKSRGSRDRVYKNTLTFLAADSNRLSDLEQAARMYLAWRSIEQDGENGLLNLDNFQRSQTRTKCAEAEAAIKARIPEAYVWLLVPSQERTSIRPRWDEYRLSASEPLAVRAAKKLKNDGLLETRLAGTLLRREMDSIPLWRGNHVSIRQLVEDFASYLYLPRLRDPQVLLEAIREGLASPNWSIETFAYADAWDALKGRYLGLKAGEAVALSATSGGLLVRPEVALKQLGGERPVFPPGASKESQPGSSPPPSVEPKPAKAKTANRFYASVKLDPHRLSRDADQIAREVLQHLLLLEDAEAEVTLEIQVRVPGGVSEPTARTVLENARTLKFSAAGFEEE